jgi:hypothetical protein
MTGPLRLTIKIDNDNHVTGINEMFTLILMGTTELIIKHVSTKTKIYSFQPLKNSTPIPMGIKYYRKFNGSYPCIRHLQSIRFYTPRSSKTT